MNTPSIPGFTAENTTFKNTTGYRTAGDFDPRSDAVHVQPAMLNVCQKLLVAMRIAIADGDTGMARFYNGVWHGAGCTYF